MNTPLRVRRIKHGFQRVYQRLLDLLTLSIGQSNRSPGFLNFQLTKSDHLASEDGFRTGCPNVSRQQQSFSGL